MQTELIIGDWSDDGHGKTYSTNIESNLSDKQIQSAYIKGVDIVGVDITEQCENYQDSTLESKYIEKLRGAGFDFSEEVEYKKGKDYQIWPSLFAAIYLFIVKVGSPDFEYEIVEAPSIKIGGYGLFD